MSYIWTAECKNLISMLSPILTVSQIMQLWKESLKKIQACRGLLQTLF